MKVKVEKYYYDANEIVRGPMNYGPGGFYVDESLNQYTDDGVCIDSNVRLIEVVGSNYWQAKLPLKSRSIIHTSVNWNKPLILKYNNFDYEVLQVFKDDRINKCCVVFKTDTAISSITTDFDGKVTDKIFVINKTERKSNFYLIDGDFVSTLWETSIENLTPCIKNITKAYLEIIYENGVPVESKIHPLKN